METEEATWDTSSAWSELAQRIELELEEKILRFKLNIGERPHLEWMWHEEPSRGGIDCTILAHIDTRESALSVKNKKHLHWKALDLISLMNNEIVFAVLAHNLLKKVNAGDTTRQANNNRAASILAPPQAARKKRFTKLDLTRTPPPKGISEAPPQVGKEGGGEGQKPAPHEEGSFPGSFSQPAAHNRLTYD